MYAIASGVSRMSPLQVLELGKFIVNQPHVPEGSKLSVDLDLVEVDDNQVLRVRYGDQAVTIGAKGTVRPVVDEVLHGFNQPTVAPMIDEPAPLLPDLDEADLTEAEAQQVSNRLVEDPKPD